MSKLKYGIATGSAIAALVGVAGLSLSQALAGEHMDFGQASNLGKQQLLTERAAIEYAIQKQECNTLKNSQPKAYESCLAKVESTRDNLLAQAQGSEQGQGSQGFASNQSQQQSSGQEKGPIDKMTSAVKETVAEVKEKLFGSSGEGQPSAGQQQQGQGSGQGGGGTQGVNPLQQGFEARHGQDFAQQRSGAASGQGGQNFGQQGTTQGQQFHGQQGQSGQGSFQGGNYGQQPQGQSWQQGTGGTNQQFQGQQGQSGQGQQGSFQGQQPQGQSNQQFQSGATQGLQGSPNQQRGSTSGWIGAKQGEHMDRSEYYQALARQQYATLIQECNTLKEDPNVNEQCQKHAESIRDQIAGMAEQGT